MQLPEFLSQAGYRRIPLQRSGIGHFHASASLRGRPVSALVDTGAGCTLVNLALARELDLTLILQPEKGGSAGNVEMDLYVVEGGRLELAEVSIRPRMLMAMDLSHVNGALVEKGQSPVEAILGLDVFEEHAAVIDYATQSLFLKS